MQLYFALALTGAAVIAWIVSLRLPLTTSRSTILALNLSPMAVAWLVVLMSPASGALNYKAYVLLGMIIALAAVIFRYTTLLPSYAAHAHLLFMYGLYACAFASQTSGWPTLFTVLPFALAGMIYFWLYPFLFELWSAVAVYTLLIVLATWQALELAVQQPEMWMGWAALAGMMLAVVATLLEAQERFRPIRRAWAAASLPVFFLAQFAIAWSVWG